LSKGQPGCCIQQQKTFLFIVTVVGMVSSIFYNHFTLNCSIDSYSTISITDFLSQVNSQFGRRLLKFKAVEYITKRPHQHYISFKSFKKRLKLFDLRIAIICKQAEIITLINSYLAIYNLGLSMIYSGMKLLFVALLCTWTI